MKTFNSEYINDIISEAQTNQRLQQHSNIHFGYDEPWQRLFNAIEPESYIRPHRHAADPKDELLIAVRGQMALINFDDQGQIINILRFGTEKHGVNLPIGAEVPSHVWHTVVSLQTGSILLEVKAGPFDPSQPEELAAWAPEEYTFQAREYLRSLINRVQSDF